MLKMDTTIRDHIEIVNGAGGPKAVIKGHRIRVEDVAVWHERLHMSPFEIVHEYPTITVADVYAALAYYWDHRVEMEAAMSEGNLFVAEMMRDGHSGVREMLRDRPGEALELLKHRHAE
jgi:uncharacterized protein (DUF433 family)